MQDELLMRRWNDAHDRFSADMDNAIQRVGTRLQRILSVIHPAYGSALRVALAGAITLALWTSFLALAAPPAAYAEGLQFELAMAVDSPAELLSA